MPISVFNSIFASCVLVLSLKIFFLIGIELTYNVLPVDDLLLDIFTFMFIIPSWWLDPFAISISAVPESTNHRWYSTVQMHWKKKNPCLSRPLQFKPVLFKSPLLFTLTYPNIFLRTKLTQLTKVMVKRIIYVRQNAWRLKWKTTSSLGRNSRKLHERHMNITANPQPPQGIEAETS